MKTTLKEGWAEMKRWHFDQTKCYVKALDATYVKIQKLKDQIEEEELSDKEESEKQTEVIKYDEATPIGKLLMKRKEVTKKPMTQKKHKDTTIRMEIKWIETKNRKTIYELVAPHVGSPTMTEQVNIKPCSRNDIIHMMLEMEYLYPLMPNPKAYYLFY